MKKPLISIIIPVYNTEKYLNRCVDSVINQTYQNLEIILVDDGSTDQSPKICDDYLAQDKRIKVIHKKNGGQNSARGEGYLISTGEYITFVDSDDWIAKEMYSRIMEYNNSAMFDVLRTEFTISDGQEILQPTQFPYQEVCEVQNRTDEIFELFAQSKIHANICCMLMKRNVIERCFPFHTAVKMGEDLLLALEILCNSQSWLFIPESYYFYFQNSNSISNKKDRILANLKDLVKLSNCITAILNKYDRNHPKLNISFHKMIFRKINHILSDKKNKEELKKMIEFLVDDRDFKKILSIMKKGVLSFKEEIVLALFEMKMKRVLHFLYSNKF